MIMLIMPQNQNQMFSPDENTLLDSIKKNKNK